MQKDTKILFPDESKQVLDGIQNFDLGSLKHAETTVRNLPIVAGSNALPAVQPVPKKNDGQPAVKKFLEGSTARLHGRAGKAEWQPPEMTYECGQLARAGYDDVTTSSEYQDQPETLAAKVTMLADLLRQSKACAAYTGAGISRAAGIADYASKAEEQSQDGKSPPKVKSPYDAQPTLAHHILTGLHTQGHLKHWVQQNHDGLPQKAGFPQHAMNEIHGSWYDPSNPVVMMSGQLRTDLFQSLLDWTDKADLVLVLGTSLAGMNADRMATSVAARQAQGKALGSVIVSLQQTQLDASCTLRIFGSLDHVLSLLAAELGLSSVSRGYVAPVIAAEHMPEEDVFLLPYGRDGFKLPAGSPLQRLDLREDQKVKLTCGQFEGDEGVVMGKNKEGHFSIQFRHEIGKAKGQKSFKAPMMRILGLWWIESAVKGLVDRIPVVSA